MEAVDFNMHRHYANYQAKQDESPDLGYRWSVGEIDDLGVLAECLGVGRKEAQSYIDFGMGSEDFELFISRKEDGQIFDWMLEGGEPPYCLKKLMPNA